jgi:hypothetical protein
MRVAAINNGTAIEGMYIYEILVASSNFTTSG